MALGCSLMLEAPGELDGFGCVGARWPSSLRRSPGRVVRWRCLEPKCLRTASGPNSGRCFGLTLMLLLVKAGPHQEEIEIERALLRMSALRVVGRKVCAAWYVRLF